LHKRAAVPAPEFLLIVGADRLLYRGPPVDGAAHRHHAIQLAVSLGEPLRLRSASQPELCAEAALIEADTPHQLLGGAPQLALLYLEPESISAAALRTARALAAQPLQVQQPSERLREQLLGFQPEADFPALCASWLGELGLTEAARPTRLDARVEQVIAHLRQHLAQRHSAAALGRRVALSPHRLMHLFRATTGLPLRRYTLWLRLRAALAAALRGASLTEAAQEAGFSDSAHLSRSFRAHFGLPPRFLFEHRDRLTVRFR
jgi:AraC family transcriptional regulator